MKKINMTIIVLVMTLFAMFAVFSANVTAGMKLDSIQYDPAIIASGDEVDIVVQFHHESIAAEEKRIGNSDYRYHVTVESDDTLTKNYVEIQDAEGDDLHGAIFSGGYYNKQFRVKVNNDAPAGNYEFKLVGQWYHLGEPEESFDFVRFKMPVKKEGIVLGISSLQTVPAEVRPGDNYVKIEGMIENSGEKDAKNVEITLSLPKGIESSYTNNNRIWVGKVNAGQSKQVTFFVDVDDEIKTGTSDFKYNFDYMDIDNNEYSTYTKLPFLVKPRPHLIVSKSEGEGLAGKSGKLYVTVKNIGEESAESVDVRLIKQNSQPFSLDVRSEYIGELNPDEEGVAIFDVAINRDAEINNYDFKLLIRSKGDSDEGDDNIYTFNRRAKFDVTGVAPNNLKTFGITAVLVIVIFWLVLKIVRKKK